MSKKSVLGKDGARLQRRTARGNPTARRGSTLQVSLENAEIHALQEVATLLVRMRTAAIQAAEEVEALLCLPSAMSSIMSSHDSVWCMRERTCTMMWLNEENMETNDMGHTSSIAFDNLGHE